MDTHEDSLFSLELVVEKLYLPHICCRFPSIAFRLLDFPTLLIDHVERDLADDIRAKIAQDPYYHIPDQFNELKDQHGNFLIKKGKSCMFKIPVDTLHAHLANTPLYVMILDTFSTVPKLLGNSTIPLTSLMENIYCDIKSVGNTVPSVHGDKGLYKIYNLMGKEIGYVIMGYRLLSLGPGLIPHIADKTIVQNSDEKSLTQADKKVSEDVSKNSAIIEKIEKDTIINSLQTPEKPNNVIISSPYQLHESKAKSDSFHAGTQTVTVKNKKNRGQASKHYQNMISNEGSFEKYIEAPSLDTVINNNIVCPPPLFYQCPKKTIDSKFHSPSDGVDMDYLNMEDDLDVYDMTDDISVESDMEEKNVSKRYAMKSPVHATSKSISVESNSNNEKDTKTSLTNIKEDDFKRTLHKHKSDDKFTSLSQNKLEGNEDFPILACLLSELSRFNLPTNLQQYFQHAQSKSLKEQKENVKPSHFAELISTKKTVKHDESTFRGHHERPLSPKKESTQTLSEYSSGPSDAKDRKHHRICAKEQPVVPKNKGWLRQVPEVGVKKTNLVYGLTNTQRLRLASKNPDWLKSLELEIDNKNKKHALVKKHRLEEPGLDVTNLSDTSTEVRHLHDADRTTTDFDATLTKPGEKCVASITKESKKSISLIKDVKVSPNKSLNRSRSYASQNRRKNKRRQHSKPADTAKSTEKLTKVHSEVVQKKSENLNPDNRDVGSPDLEADYRSASFEEDDEFVSVYSDQLSARSQKSIEIRIPSADIQEYDQSDTESETSFGSPEPPSDVTSTKFPGFMNKDDKVLGSIEGKPQKSLNWSTSHLDDNQPLESTRYSKDWRATYADSKLFQSTGDTDTKQFQSTDEPELQLLMSDGDSDQSERSKLSPKSDSQSHFKFPQINPVTSDNSPAMSLRKSQLKFDADSLKLPAPDTPRSQGSSRHPTPTPRGRRGKDSLDPHSDSISSYVPTDGDFHQNSLSDPNYSDEFQSETDSRASSRQSPSMPRIISSTRLGYTIA